MEWINVPLASGPVCGKCQQPARSIARFCGRCGAPLEGFAPTDAPTAVASASPAITPHSAPRQPVLQPLLQPSPSPGIVDSAGRYRTEQLLGKGGFGEAYIAQDTRLDRPCVVKRLVIPPGGVDPAIVRENFAREARMLVTLNTPGHPNIPEIYEYLPEQYALVMKYIAGQNLANVLNRRADPLPEHEALRYARDVCSALVYMHSRLPEPVLHRDIKPANILLGNDGRIWLIDFGLSKAVAALSHGVQRDATQLAGTPGYSPPEQWHGATEPRSDVYALAATLFMLLTNRRPSQAEIGARTRGEPGAWPPLRHFLPNVRPELEVLLRSSLTTAIAERPTAQVFLETIETLLRRPVIPPPPEPQQPPMISLLIGREAELAHCLDQLRIGNPTIITGLAGVGKTAFAATLARQSGEIARTYWHTFHPGEGVDSLIWNLAAFCAWNDHDELWQLLQSARLTGGHPPPAETLIEYVLTLLRDQKYLICLDDYQLVADDPLLDQFVRRLSADAQQGRLQLLIAARAVPSVARTAHLHVLQGIDHAAVATLLVQHDLALDASLVAALSAHTGGNPQLLLLAIEALHHTANPAGVIATLAAVTDIERYLLNEVDAQLNPDERVVMEALAALLGYPAHASAVEALLDTPRGVRRTLQHLTHRQLLIATDAESGRTFHQHTIVQTFYYEHLSPSERTTLHARAAVYYAQETDDPLQVARHFQLAKDWPRAADALVGVTSSIINRGQARALAVVLNQFQPKQLDERRWIAVLIARGDVAALLGQTETAHSAYQAALGLTAQPTNEPIVRLQRAQICYGLGALLEYDAPQEALNWLERGLEYVDRADPTLAGALSIKIGTVLIPLGRYAEAHAALDRAADLLPGEQSQLRMSLLHTLGTLYSSQGQIERGIAYTREGLAICEALHDTVRMAKMLSNLAIDRLISGDTAGALVDFAHARALAEQIGNGASLLVIDLNVGIAHARNGDDVAAIHHLQSGVQLAQQTNTRYFEISGRASLADIYARQGNRVQAREQLVIAEQLATEIDAQSQLPELYRIWAHVLLDEANTIQARHYIERSLALARTMGLGTDEGIGLRVLGDIEDAVGDRAAAATYFAQSMVLLTDVDPFEAERTRARLNALQSTPHADSVS